eukprot:Hpha_TRINITY_DN14521_c0_g1::TRINITY_DN14521_c0_g1_i1::g.46586::m.46586
MPNRSSRWEDAEVYEIGDIPTIISNEGEVLPFSYRLIRWHGKPRVPILVGDKVRFTRRNKTRVSLVELSELDVVSARGRSGDQKGVDNQKGVSVLKGSVSLIHDGNNSYYVDVRFTTGTTPTKSMCDSMPPHASIGWWRHDPYNDSKEARPNCSGTCVPLVSEHEDRLQRGPKARPQSRAKGASTGAPTPTPVLAPPAAWESTDASKLLDSNHFDLESPRVATLRSSEDASPGDAPQGKYRSGCTVSEKCISTDNGEMGDCNKVSEVSSRASSSHHSGAGDVSLEAGGVSNQADPSVAKGLLHDESLPSHSPRIIRPDLDSQGTPPRSSSPILFDMLESAIHASREEFVSWAEENEQGATGVATNTPTRM